MKLIDRLKFPEDMKKLTKEESEALCVELREFLMQSVSKTGGHLASNLGIVEATVSLMRVFDFSRDKIVWDVGHQSYVYKILTGRKDKFDTLRQFEGMSGFPKRNESQYDYFDTGHSSTSVSAALGMARARDIKKENYNVVAVIGDGALTGGMALEALNDLGFSKTKMIIILNDNQMSISPNVGGMSKYLNKLRMKPQYNRIKGEIHQSLNQYNFGKNLVGTLSRVKGSIKQLIVPSMFFEDIGIKYIGPIDGHDIETMTEVFNIAKDYDGPLLIHLVTRKGKGYALAEKSPTKFHGVKPFDLESGEANNFSITNYSKEFGKALVEEAEKDKRIVAITAAMPEGTGLDPFRHAFKNRFFDVGIAEQHAVTLAAGMAANGLKPVFAVYSTFLQRAFDQIIHDVCIQKLPVVFAVDRAGIVGEDGETHQGIMDVSYLSMIPNMTVIAPKCMAEIKPMLKWAFNKNAPVAIRYPRGEDTLAGLEPVKEIQEGKWEILNEGRKVCVIASGKMVQQVLKVKEVLYTQGINPMIVNALFLKPVDKDLIKQISDNGYNILTIEDNILKGGLGSAVKECLCEYGYKGRIKSLGYDDKFIPQGKVDQLYKAYGLDSDNIRNQILELC